MLRRGLALVLQENSTTVNPGILTSKYNFSSSLEPVISPVEPEGDTSEPSTSTEQIPAPPPKKLPAGHIDFSQKQMVMIFTCAKCDVRATKAFSKEAYTKGVVIIECPGCSSRHLIADHLGYFGSKGTVEDFVLNNGGEIVQTQLADGSLELNLLSDIAGIKKK